MKVKKYAITCFSYAINPKKIEGSYLVSINANNQFSTSYDKVKSPEEGLKIIEDLTKDWEFVVEPDLTIKDSKILGKHIFTMLQ